MRAACSNKPFDFWLLARPRGTALLLQNAGRALRRGLAGGRGRFPLFLIRFGILLENHNKGSHFNAKGCPLVPRSPLGLSLQHRRCENRAF
jgi:hypothetical protein